MIKSLKIWNFQSHEETKLNFSPGVNVIVGDSDSGKSAIIRALRWIVYGKPKGDGVCSWWGGGTKVSIEIDDLRVIRRKDKTGNSYKLLQDGDSKTFRAIGTDIPEEIEKLINLDEINIQRQGDKHFLLSNTSGEVAQQFNRMAQLEKIDIGRKNIESAIRDTTIDLRKKAEEKKELKQSYRGFAYIEDVEQVLETLESLSEELKNLENTKKGISLLLPAIETTEKAIKAESRLLKAEDIVFYIRTLYADKTAKTDKVSQISAACEQIDTLASRIKKREKLLSAETAVNQILVKYNEMQQTTGNRKKLRALVQDIQDKHSLILTQEMANISNEKEYKEIFPKTCPLCGNKTK